MIKEVKASLRLSCNFEIISVSVSPSLPDGFKINTEIGENTTGLISGTPLYSINPTSYTVSVGRRGSPDLIQISVRISVIESIKNIECHYNIKRALFMKNYPNHVVSPKCNSYIWTFTSENLPDGIELDRSSGAIRGTAANAKISINETATIYGLTQGAEVKIILLYDVIDPASSEASVGMLARFAFNQVGFSYENYNVTSNRFESEDITSYMKVLNETKLYCLSKDNCVEVGGSKDTNVYCKMTFSLYLETAGDYEFLFVSEGKSIIVLYFDKNPPKIFNSGETFLLYVNNSNIGWNPISLLYYNDKATDINYRIEVKRPGEKYFSIINDEYMHYAYTEHLEYSKQEPFIASDRCYREYDQFSNISNIEEINGIKIYSGVNCIAFITLLYGNSEKELPEIKYNSKDMNYEVFKLHTNEVINGIVYSVSESKCFDYIKFKTSRNRQLIKQLNITTVKEERSVMYNIAAIYECLDYKNETSYFGFYTINHY